MSKKMRRAIAISVFAAVLAVPATLIASHSWNGYHWARTSNPFNLKVGDNVNTTWDSYLNTTVSDWSNPVGGAKQVVVLTKVGGLANPKNCRPTSGRVEVCNSTYGQNGWLGVAQIWLSGGHISQGIVKLNDTYFNTAKYNTPAWRNLVSCQEVGHTLGLDHNDEDFNNTPTGTCMDYSNDPVPNQHPDAHDFEELAQIYSHLDTTTTVGQSTAQIASSMPPAMRNMDFEGPGQWGRLVKGSRAKGHSTYVQDFGKGNKVITFVFWTEEAQHSHE